MAIGSFGMPSFFRFSVDDTNHLVCYTVSLIGTLLYIPSVSHDIDLTYDTKYTFPGRQ